METLVAVKDIVKRFPGTVALHNVSFDVKAGEVHVLLGENGAGKSTLMKILGGIYEPSSGTITLGGTEYDKLTPTLSAEHGVRVIYQELSVIDYLSVEENLFVGKIPTVRLLGVPVVDRKFMNAKAREVLARVGLRRDPRTLVGDLSISEKQQVEIAKALASDARLIIMDEPTSSLTDEEVGHLFTVISELKRAGVGIVYISHKLKEIPIVGDRVSVLKDGKYVGTYDAKTTSTERLVSSMVGRDIEHTRPDSTAVERAKVVFSVSKLSSKDGRVRDVSFELHRGEILGFAGLIGSGRSELMETIFGVRARSAGELFLNGQAIHITSPYQAVKRGLAFVTEDRRNTGFFHNFSIEENISIVPFLRDTKRALSLGLLDRAKEKRFGREYRERLRIRCSSTAQNITELSGGNQQKAIISKWLAAGCDLMIFDEPTRGIDIGAKSEIYQIMRELAKAGKGILMVSSELPELLGVCDRIVVYKEGRIASIFDNRDATEENIMHVATS
ncbi:sugar ABC transporter ATP-binding protein [Pararobbsia alpina]|uniref:Galactose/methyl galactoside import ATP-binding protein MglA n=1 Tax=Pararobbsia alpina TaxID=621374 RepID=A0A6S7B8F0_9BURK|nr:sugar ABC transporter ATP-binding protein [Pararobbsia alpina]CAB3791590.1 Galactose/methyl galactoside import ATP-binding protein MglA [Pararobbsia alpina]